MRQLLTSFEENLGKCLPLSKAGPVRICRRSPGAGRSLAHRGPACRRWVLWRGAGSGLRSRGSWPILGGQPPKMPSNTYRRLVHNDALDMIRVGFNLKGFEMTVNGYAEILDRCDGAVRG